MCRKLYERCAKYAAESGAHVAVDAYSGGGLLTAMLAKQLGKAYGIESVREAVECADELVEANKLEGRVTNLCGRVEDRLPELLRYLNGQDVFLVCDPPRKGIDRATVRAILGSGIRTVAIISCNPATMARDVGILTGALIETEQGLVKNPAYAEEGMAGFYRPRLIQPLDMFPQTKHVETLVLLSKKPDESLG